MSKQKQVIVKNCAEALCQKAKFKLQSKLEVIQRSRKPSSMFSEINARQSNLCVAFQVFKYQVCVLCGNIPVLPNAVSRKSFEKCNCAFTYFLCVRIRSDALAAGHDSSKNTASLLHGHLPPSYDAPTANICAPCNRQLICFRWMVLFLKNLPGLIVLVSHYFLENFILGFFFQSFSLHTEKMVLVSSLLKNP